MTNKRLQAALDAAQATLWRVTQETCETGNVMDFAERQRLMKAYFSCKAKPTKEYKEKFTKGAQ